MGVIEKMSKCVVCGRRKGKRSCPAAKGAICSPCCGSQRGKTIVCLAECAYLNAGEEYFYLRKIRVLVKQSFNDDEDKKHDAFLDQDVVDIVAPLELFFIEAFYGEKTVTDEDIFNALAKIHWTFDEPGKCRERDALERKIYEKFQEITAQQPNIPVEKQKLCLLRLMKSIDRVSGGILGNRNYLELIFSQFSRAGRWSYMFNE